MDWATFVTLVRLRHSLELRAEWVAVGHISYLIDMFEPDESDRPDGRQTRFPITSFSIH